MKSWQRRHAPPPAQQLIDWLDPPDAAQRERWLDHLAGVIAYESPPREPWPARPDDRVSGLVICSDTASARLLDPSAPRLGPDPAGRRAQQLPSMRLVRVALRPEGLELDCTCVSSNLGPLCGHAQYTVRLLFAVLDAPGAPTDQLPPVPTREQVAAWHARRHAARLERLLAQAAGEGPGQVVPLQPGSTAGVRLVWRVGQDGVVPTVHAVEQRLRVKGGWNAGRRVPPAQLLYYAQRDSAPPELRAVGRQIVYEGTYVPHGAELDGRLALDALEGSPHVFLDGDPPRPLSVERATPELKLVREDDGLCMVPLLRAADGLLRPVECPVEPGHGVMVAWDLPGARVLVGRAPARVRELLAHLVSQAPLVPWGEGPGLMARLAQLEAVLPVRLPADMVPEKAAADARPRLVLASLPVPTSLAPADALDRPVLRVGLRVRPLDLPRAATPQKRRGAAEETGSPRPPLFAPGVGRASLPAPTPEGLIVRERDLDAEVRAARSVADALGLRGVPAEDGQGQGQGQGQGGAPVWDWGLDLEGALALLERLQDDPPAGLVIEWEGEERLRVSRPIDDRSFQVTVRGMRDWFQLDGGLEVDGERIELALLLSTLRQGQKYVTLPGGRFLRLSERLRTRLESLRAAAREQRGALELDLTAAPVVAEALDGLAEEAGGGAVQLDRGWRDVMERLARARKVSVKVPRRLRAELRDYQREGWAWLKRLSSFGAGACLADDMGLGKTVQTIAVLLDRAGLGPALVVAPTSVVPNWARELERFAPSLRVHDLRRVRRAPSPSRGDDALEGLAAGDVLLASYELARIEAPWLQERGWATLVLDEAQRVKNALTATAEALARIPAEWRLALTGTPLENRLADLWGLFRIVSPGLFGSWASFRDRFAVPIERDRDPQAAAALARLIRPYVLRRTKEQVLTELPPRSEQRLEVTLSPGERALYDDAQIEALARLEGLLSEQSAQETRFDALAALTRLRQLACHPALVEGSWPGHSSKLRALLGLVGQLIDNGHRALVFSQFTSHLALVREALEQEGIGYRYLDGSTPARERQAAIDAFQAGQEPLFLISLKAGGVGLNLTGADYVIHLDPWWNPAVEDQATGRAHRIGQTRPVTVYRLVTRDTVEERILALHAHKRGLVAAVLDGTDRAGALSTEELVALIRGAGPASGPDARADEPLDVETGPQALPGETTRSGEPRALPTGPVTGDGPRGGPAGPSTGAAAREWPDGPWDGYEMLLRRTRRGYSQKQLARRIGTTAATVSAWELERRAPSQQWLKSIRAALPD